jgi:hypothetical protein
MQSGLIENSRKLEIMFIVSEMLKMAGIMPESMIARTVAGQSNVPANAPPVLLIRKAGEVIQCNEKKLNLKRKVLVEKLFSIFLEAGGAGISKEEVLRKIYGDRQLENKSEQYNENLGHNVVKIISRARMMARRKLSGIWSDRVKWFVFDRKESRWYFYRVKRP